MKLELKHLLTYPNAKCQLFGISELFEFEDYYDEEKFRDGSVWTFAGYADKDLCIPLGEGEISYLFRSCSTYISVSLNHAKPILRPLSDLTKEIEVGGERFIPVEKLCDLYSPKFHNSYQNDKCAGFVYGFAAHDVLNLKNIFENKYWQIEKLFEWHFNVFNLPEDLWIDINKLPEY